MKESTTTLRILLAVVISFLLVPGGLRAEHESSVPGGGTPFTVPTASLSPPDAFPLPHYHGPHPITGAPDPNLLGGGWGAGTPIPHQDPPGDLEPPGPDFTMRTGGGTGYTPGADFDASMRVVGDSLRLAGEAIDDYLILGPDMVGLAETIKQVLDTNQAILDAVVQETLDEGLADAGRAGGSAADFNAEPPPFEASAPTSPSDGRR